MPVSSSLPSEFDRGNLTPVHQGDCRVSSDETTTFSTILGSCIAACVRDVEAGLGGMNHFLLARQTDHSRDRFGASARYGAFAMEQLINQVLAGGTGKKSNLEIKIFGGGKINAALDDVGAKNIAFVRSFLQTEGYQVKNQDIGGTFARRVLFKPVSGRAMCKRLDSETGATIARKEIAIAARTGSAKPEGDIELF